MRDEGWGMRNEGWGMRDFKHLGIWQMEKQKEICNYRVAFMSENEVFIQWKNVKQIYFVSWFWHFENHLLRKILF